jgi:hypothetical protein
MARLTMLFLAMVATVAVATAAGCGGSGDSAVDSGNQTGIKTSSLSKNEFIQQASEDCREQKKDILSRVLTYTKEHEPKHPTRAQETAVFAAMTKAVVLPTVKKEIVAIRHLGAPSGDEDEIGTFLASEEEAVKGILNLDHIVSRFEIERYFGPSAKIAYEYGLEACANSEP